MKIYSYQGRANIIGERLRIARERKELSQDAVAARMQVEGVSPVSYTHLSVYNCNIH